MKMINFKLRCQAVLSLILLLSTLGLSAQNITKLAFKQVEVVNVEGITMDYQLYSLGADKKSVTIEYVDGLARPVQQIAIGASPQQKDIVVPIVYDQYGRKTKEFLPYLAGITNGVYQPNAVTAQTAFYANGSSDKVADDTKPFVQREYENSPLQRLLREGSIGEGFQLEQKFNSSSFRANNAADNVRLWKTDGSSTSMYAAGSLQVLEQTDEQARRTLVFQDKNGRNILQRVQADETVNGIARPYFDTYYIYNDLDQISYVIPPKAVAQMQTANTWNVQGAGIGELVYSYVYDELGRMVEKKTPGAQPIFIIYDNADRVLLVQDGNLRTGNKWYYNKYNSSQQIIAEGIHSNSQYTTRASMQTYIASLNLQLGAFEERQAGTTFGYSNRVFPTTNLEELSYYYYDDYDLNNDGTRDYSYQAQALSAEATPFYQTKGTLTATKKKIVGETSWLSKVYFYDKRGNMIQELSNNQIYATVADSKTLVPDFVGKVITAKTVKSTSATVKTTVTSNFVYDHVGRLKTVSDSYNGAAAIQVAAYQYNELGQPVEKNIHKLPGTGTNYLQSVDYRYNIRGQMTSINNSTLTADDKNDDANDLFGMEILYNALDNSLVNTPLYNGHISAVKWRTKTPSDNNPKERSYRYTYDKLDRMTDAFYLERVAGSAWSNTGAFDEKGIRYDENGNILALTRNGSIGGSTVLMDQLNYTYLGNQLTNITDGGSAAQGFKNTTGSTAVYEYTATGSLKTDPKKGITITYNLLNKDERITVTTAVGRYIKYTYDGGGILLRKQVYDNNLLQKTTDYIDGFVYENNVLAYFGMTEGRIRNAGGSLKPEYMLKDYQGNVRVSFEELNGVAVVRQDNGYYPFGLITPGNTVPSQPNKNLYNGGSEWQNDFGDLPDYYKTHYRNYDAALGRFTAIDIRADENVFVSPYQYALNNPIMYNDPLGDKERALKDVIMDLSDSPYGGTWSSGGDGYLFFGSNADVFQFGAAYMDRFGSWGMYGFAQNFNSAERTFNQDNRLSLSEPRSNGQKDFIVMGKWYRNADGSATTVNDVSGTMVLVDLRGETNNTIVSASFNDNLGQILNLAGVVWGSAELGIQTIRQNNGPQAMGRFLGFGTQRTAEALKQTFKTVSKMGKYAGTAGMVLSTYSYGSQILNNPGKISTATHVNFWVGAGLYGGAALIGGPVIAGAAVIYGVGQLGSYLYNGKTLEENIIGN